MGDLHELGQKLGQTVRAEHQAYRVLATNLYTYTEEPKGPLAPIAKALRRASVEVYIGPLFYAGMRLVQGDSPEKIKEHEQGMLDWKRESPHE